MSPAPFRLSGRPTTHPPYLPIGEAGRYVGWKEGRKNGRTDGWQEGGGAEIHIYF